MQLARLAVPLLAVSLFVFSPATAKEFTNLKIAEPQPAVSGLQPGLAVRYVYEKFDSLAEVENWAKGVKPVDGKPLPQLNYKMGDGEVLTSGKEDFVGAFIDGFIHLSGAPIGAQSYRAAVVCVADVKKDGMAEVRLTIGKHMLADLYTR